MADKLFDPDTFLILFHFPHDQFNKRVTELTESITADIAADKITLPGSVVAGGKVKEHIRQMAKDQANEEFAKQREKSKLAETQRQEYFDLCVAQELEGFPTALATSIRSLAWDNGHSSGHYEVLNYVRDYRDRFEDFALDLVRLHSRIGDGLANHMIIKGDLGKILAGGKDKPLTINSK